MRNYTIDVLRGLAAAGVLLAAVVHLDLWASGFRDIQTIGPLFMVDAVAGIVLGVGVLVWRHWLPALLAAGFGAATVGAYWISVVHGLFGVKETTSGWSENLAEGAEYAVLAFGLAAALLLFSGRRLRTTIVTIHAPRQRPNQVLAGPVVHRAAAGHRESLPNGDDGVPH